MLGKAATNLIPRQIRQSSNTVERIAAMAEFVSVGDLSVEVR